MKLPVILFFIGDENPTEEEMNTALEIRGQVRFRNALLHVPGSAVETFDALEGGEFIPQDYIDAFEAKEEAKRVAQERAEMAAAAAAAAAEKAAKKGGKSSGASGAAPTNTPAPGAAPGAGSGPPADWKPNA